MSLLLVLAGMNGAMAVLMGAYASHGISDEYLKSIGTLASQYQLVHAAVLVGAHYLVSERRALAGFAGLFLVIGILLFSGTLYIRALGFDLPLPMLTPAGGIILALGWLFLAISGFFGRR